MRTLEDVFKHFKLSEEDIRRISKEARAAAVKVERGVDHPELSADTWNLLDNISDYVWNSNMPVEEKITVGFSLFESFPTYYQFLLPYYHLIRDATTIKAEYKELIWKKFMEYLGGEAYYADPTLYVLWVEFFEDGDTVRETWLGLMAAKSSSTLACLRLIQNAGPVPYDLKAPLYVELLKNEEHHPVIFQSLLFSANDAFGQIDKENAITILDQLKINKTTPEFELLKRQLS